jgi:hypothetical protein
MRQWCKYNLFPVLGAWPKTGLKMGLLANLVGDRTKRAAAALISVISYPTGFIFCSNTRAFRSFHTTQISRMIDDHRPFALSVLECDSID